MVVVRCFLQSAATTLASPTINLSGTPIWRRALCSASTLEAIVEVDKEHMSCGELDGIDRKEHIIDGVLEEARHLP